MTEVKFTGKWWLVTWTTFGTWLPGDPRGFQTWRKREYVPPPRRYAQPDEVPYNASDYHFRHQRAKTRLSQPPVFLTLNQTETARDAILHELGQMPMVPAILAIDSIHVHLLAQFRIRIRSAVGRLKMRATKWLHERGFEENRVWVRVCHMKSKDTRDAMIAAFTYIHNHQDEGALVHDWQHPLFDGIRKSQADGMPSA